MATIGVSFSDLGGNTTGTRNFDSTFPDAYSGVKTEIGTIPAGAIITRYGIRAASTTGAMTSFDLGLYESGTDGIPTNLVSGSEATIPVSAINSNLDNFTVTLSTPFVVPTAGTYQVAAILSAATPTSVVGNRIAESPSDETSIDENASPPPLPNSWSETDNLSVGLILFVDWEYVTPNTSSFLEAPLFTFTSA